MVVAVAGVDPHVVRVNVHRAPWSGESCPWWRRRRRWRRGRGCGLKIPSPYISQFSSCTRPLQFNAQQSESQDFSICFQTTVVQVFALCLRRTDVLDHLLSVLCCRLAHCGGSIRKGKSLYVHITHRGFVVTEDIHESQVSSPSTTQCLAETY